MSFVMSDWIDQLFEDVSSFELTWKVESYLFNLLEFSTLSEEEKEELEGQILSKEMTQEEVSDLITNLKLNQKREIDQYAPTQKQISSFISKIISQNGFTKNN